MAAQLIAAIRQMPPLTGAVFYASTPASDFTECSNLVNDVWLNKAYVWKLMSKTLGFGAGKFAVKSTSHDATVTDALAATNAAGQPVAILVNDTSNSIGEIVKFRNLSFSGTIDARVWLVDHGSDRDKQTQNDTVIVANGIAYETVVMPPHSVAGIKL